MKRRIGLEVSFDPKRPLKQPGEDQTTEDGPEDPNWPSILEEDEPASYGLRIELFDGWTVKEPRPGPGGTSYDPTPGGGLPSNFLEDRGAACLDEFLSSVGYGTLTDYFALKGYADEAAFLVDWGYSSLAELLSGEGASSVPNFLLWAYAKDQGFSSVRSWLNDEAGYDFAWVDVYEGDENPDTLKDKKTCEFHRCGHYAWYPWTTDHQYHSNEGLIPDVLIQAQYGPDNPDRWDRRPLAFTHIRDNGRRWTYGRLDDKRCYDFLIELKSRNGHVRFTAGPDMELGQVPEKGRKMKALMPYRDNVPPEQGATAKNTSGAPERFHLAVREIGTKSFGHYLSKTIGGNLEYAADFIEPEGVFFSPFDTSDKDHYKVTRDLSYDAEEVTGPVVDMFLIAKCRVFLMPRRVGYYLRHTFGKYEAAEVSLTYSYSCGCEGIDRSPGHCGMEAHSYCGSDVGDCLNTLDNRLFQTYGVWLTAAEGDSQWHWDWMVYEDPIKCAHGQQTYEYYYVNPAAPAYDPYNKPFVARRETGWSEEKTNGPCDARYEAQNAVVTRTYTKFDGYFITAVNVTSIHYDRLPTDFPWAAPAQEEVETHVHIIDREPGGHWTLVHPVLREDETFAKAKRPVIMDEPLSGFNSFHVTTGRPNDLFFLYYQPGASPDLIYLPVVPASRGDGKHVFSGKDEWYINWPPPFSNRPVWRKIHETDIGKRLGFGGTDVPADMGSFDAAYGVGLVPNPEGALVAVILSGHKPYFVWRRTEEQFELNVLGDGHRFEMPFEDQRSAHMPLDGDIGRMNPVYYQQTTGLFRRMERAFLPECTSEGQLLFPCTEPFALIGCRVKRKRTAGMHGLDPPLYVMLTSPLLFWEEDSQKWLGSNWEEVYG
ncbi:MAG: hypothetical protein V2B18_02065 [Pseudomonadota bacterium]